MAVTEAGTRVKEAAAGSAIVRPWRPPSTGIAATGYGFVEVLMASPTLVVIFSKNCIEHRVLLILFVNWNRMVTVFCIVATFP